MFPFIEESLIAEYENMTIVREENLRISKCRKDLQACVKKFERDNTIIFMEIRDQGENTSDILYGVLVLYSEPALSTLVFADSSICTKIYLKNTSRENRTKGKLLYMLFILKENLYSS